MSLTRDGVPVVTTPRVISTLLYLVEHAGRTVTRDEMMRAIWPGRLIEETSLNQAISEVRKLLAGAEDSRDWIITVPGLGYRFTGEVTVHADDGSPFQAPTEPDGTGPPPAHGAARRPLNGPARLWAVILGVVIAGGAALVLAGLFARPIARLPRDRTEVVVADLQNETGDPAFNHLIPRILQVDLAQSPFLRVSSDAKIAHTLALMERPANSPLTETAGREVCARNNGGAVIAPAVMSLGASYLLTVAASDCLNGRTLYQDKIVASGKDAVGGALEHLSNRLRRHLGEDQASISHTDVPLTAVRTASFDALAAYSEGVWLHAHDRELEAITAFRHAIELDPSFAMAYDGLYNPLYATRQHDLAKAAATRAYALRNTVSDRERLVISSHYHFFVDSDLTAAQQDLKLLTNLYPHDEKAWANLSNVENQLGDYPAAVKAGEHALNADPNDIAGYSVLARALNHGGQVARSVEIDELAMKKGVAGGDTRGQLIGSTFDLGQRARADQIVEESKGTPLERDALMQAYDIDAERGELRRATAAIAHAEELGRPAGLHTDPGAHAGDFFFLGQLDKARAALALVSPSERDGFYYLLAAGIDDPGTVEAGLKRAQAAQPRDTLLNEFFAPQVRAVLLWRRGHAREAVAAFSIATPLIFHHIEAPYWRGMLQLDAGDAADAAQSFRMVLAQPGFGYSNPYDLARLGLARALRRTGDLKGSRQAYEAFLSAWKDADPDLPALIQAKAEYDQVLAGKRSTPS